jgi:hypothetical protein
LISRAIYLQIDGIRMAVVSGPMGSPANLQPITEEEGLICRGGFVVQKVIKEELLDYMKAIKPRKNSFARLLMDTKDPKTGTHRLF